MSSYDHCSVLQQHPYVRCDGNIMYGVLRHFAISSGERKLKISSELTKLSHEFNGCHFSKML